MDRSRGDEAVTGLASYGLLARLLEEQCEAIDEPQAAGDADSGDPPAPVVLKDAKEVRSDSLQTPHDPSLTYSGKKGEGEEVHLAETRGNGSKPELITYAEVTRSCDSDEGATVPAVDVLARRGIGPKELLADTSYGSTGNAVECERRGVELASPVPGPKVDEPEAASGPHDQLIPKADFDIDPKG